MDGRRFAVLVLSGFALGTPALSGCFAKPETCVGCRMTGASGGGGGDRALGMDATTVDSSSADGTGGAGTGDGAAGDGHADDTGVGGAGAGGSGAGGSSISDGAAGDGAIRDGGAGGIGTGGNGTGGGSAGAIGTGGDGAGGSGTGGAAGPIVLSIDFVGGMQPGAMGTTPMGATEIAGVKSAANWNSAPGNTGTKGALVLSTGLVTAASITWNAPSNAMGAGTWRIGYTDAPGNVRMMNGYLDPVTPATISVTGLPPAITAGGYDVYVYTSGDVPAGQTRSGSYSIGATSTTVVQAGPFANPFPGFALAPNNGAGNYVVLKGFSAASFTLTATPMTLDRAPVNGLQIVPVSGP